MFCASKICLYQNAQDDEPHLHTTPLPYQKNKYINLSCNYLKLAPSITFFISYQHV